jgi:Mismatch repair ATPase (MutS family)
MGARLFRQWLKQPLFDLDLINERYDCIEEFRTNFMLCEKLRNNLNDIQDLPRIVVRIILPGVGVNDLVSLRESLIPLQNLTSFFNDLHSPFFKKITEKFDSLGDLLELLENGLLENPSFQLREGGFIANNVSEKLDELRNISKNSKEFLNEMLQKEKERTGISSLKISYNKIF